MESITSILVLGSNGMLGSAVTKVLKEENTFDIYTTIRNNTTNYLLDAKKNLEVQIAQWPKQEFDYVINCIGIIKPYCKDDDQKGVQTAIEVNALFPHNLAHYFPNSTKIIQIATDCVYSGEKGNYTEDEVHDAHDVYGKSKSLGEVRKQNFLNLRCSIIGFEDQNKLSLLEWFLNQPEKSELKGFTNHHWNGITARRFGILCKEIISGNHFEALRGEHHTHHVVPRNSVNKYQLLHIFKNVFNKEVYIKPYATPQSVDRTLQTTYSSINNILPPITIEEDVLALAQSKND